MSNIGPKEKVSRPRSKSRRAANYYNRISVPSVVECPQCHEMKQAHRVCAKCGYYDGVEVVSKNVKEKKD